MGLLWWFSGWYPMHPVQETQVHPLVKELDPTCCN